jgi:hypothetical protein
MVSKSAMQPVVMTPGTVGKLFKVRHDTVLGWIRQGLLPATDMARAGASRQRWRISEEDLAEFRKRRGAQPRPAAPARRQKTRPAVREYV